MTGTDNRRGCDSGSGNCMLISNKTPKQQTADAGIRVGGSKHLGRDVLPLGDRIGVARD